MHAHALLKTSLLVLAGVAIAPETRGPAHATPRLTHQKPAVQAPARPDRGIRPCPPGPVDNYLDSEKQQCWLEAPHGRWRTLNHEFHYTVLVVEVEAASLDDGLDIIRRFVNAHEDMFSEILVYVQAESAPATSRIRRVRWTKKNGFETLEFTGALER